MGKFEGILLCSDLDDTLLTSDKRISDKNKKAIEYFMREGGLFTFATGRVVEGARLMLKYIQPNVPMICFNGAGIYDFMNEKLLYLKTLDKEAVKAVEYMYKKAPHAAIDVCTATESFFCRTNPILERHKFLENLPDNYIDYTDIKDDWVKVIFMTEEHQVQNVKKIIAESEFADRFDFMQSSPWYYEMLPKNSGKGSGLLKLSEILGIPIEKTIGVGDNHNDITLVREAGLGIAVANAADEVKQVADIITVDNNSDAISSIIESIERNF